MNYVRGCINQIEAVRPEMPTVRENGCWTATDSYVVCWIVIRKWKLYFVLRVWLIGHGTCKRMNPSTAFVMNVMDVIRQYDHWQITSWSHSYVCFHFLHTWSIRIISCSFFFILYISFIWWLQLLYIPFLILPIDLSSCFFFLNGLFLCKICRRYTLLLEINDVLLFFMNVIIKKRYGVEYCTTIFL